jgi:hypothetical protein
MGKGKSGGRIKCGKNDFTSGMDTDIIEEREGVLCQ